MDKYLDVGFVDLDDIFKDREEIPENWLIDKDKLIGIQNDILDDDSFNFLVKGPAGSGKTVLATYKLMDLLSLGKKDNVMLIVYTKALKEFIKAGLENTLNQYEQEILAELNLHNLSIDSLNIYNIDSGDYRTALDDQNIEYLIVDEVQDMKVYQLGEIFEKDIKIMLFGDSDQMLYRHGILLDDIIGMWGDRLTNVYEIREHYRVPKKIMEFASKIINKPELVNICRSKEDTKEQIKCFENFEEEIEFVIRTIGDYSLTHVGIFANNNEFATETRRIFKNHGLECNYKIDDEEKLDFNDTEIPTILTYHSSKGIQFENVFVVGCGIGNVYASPEEDHNNLKYGNALFVACTRTTKRVFITYSKEINRFMEDIIDRG